VEKLPVQVSKESQGLDYGQLQKFCSHARESPKIPMVCSKSPT
jgi:hypothetical protein